MTEHFKKMSRTFIYLVRCVMRGEKPNPAKFSNDINFSIFYKFAESQSLSAICCMALDSAGLLDEKYMSPELIKMWTDARDKAIRKNILLDFKRDEICAFMEEKRIWYMPLKGVILCTLYPHPGMRQMSDNDILFDMNGREKVHMFFMDAGFECKSYNRGNHDVYMMEPIYNYEMHVSLFSDGSGKALYEYYKNIKAKLIKDDNNDYGYHFTHEDFYLYFLTHAYKHHSGGGTGFRTLLDEYVYMNHYKDTLDWDYVRTELEKLEISEFERDLRHLAGKLFGYDADRNYMLGDEEIQEAKRAKDSKDGKISNNYSATKNSGGAKFSRKLTLNEKHMLANMLTLGTYGNVSNWTISKLKGFQTEKGLIGKLIAKIKYLKARLYPSSSTFKEAFPFFYKYKIFLPLLPLYRFGRSMIKNRTNVVAEIKEYFKY